MTVSDEIAKRDALDALQRVLRNVRPARIVALDEEGERRDVAVGAGKGKWDRVLDNVASMMDDLERIELLDVDGALLRTWKPPVTRRASSRVMTDPVPVEPPAVAVAETPEEAFMRRAEAFAFRMLDAVQSASDLAVKRHMAGTDAVTNRLLATLEMTAAQNRELMKQQSETMRTLYQATVARAEAESRQPDESPADALIGQLAAGLLGTGAPEQSSAREEGDEPPASNGAAH